VYDKPELEALLPELRCVRTVFPRVELMKNPSEPFVIIAIHQADEKGTAQCD
jgi:hypothetical protein